MSTHASQPSQGVERSPQTIYESAETAAREVAAEIADLIRQKAKRGKHSVLGLSTGSTPAGVYSELVRMHRAEGLSFANVIAFNLDEYWPMPADALQSYHRFMGEYLFDHVDVPVDNVHIPDGTISADEIEQHCLDYEQRIAEAGGIDFQLLGIGRTGHIGFNEPGSPRSSRTRVVTLDRVTRLDAASDFFGERHVPRKAITMGVGTILDARRIVLMAFGEHKSRIIRCAIEEPPSEQVSASFLQEHPNARFVLDSAAAASLTPIRTPWLLGPLAEHGQSWDAQATRRAVVWLAQKLDKAILKLTDQDYSEAGLQELLSTRGSAYDINLEVFEAIKRTITGWPGGKRGRRRADGSGDVFPKRVLVFSPHPDDDVISMGGSLIRLCEQGHDVHVAYQTSGNIAVFDDAALRHAEFASDYLQALGYTLEDAVHPGVEQLLAAKQAGEIDAEPVQVIKRLIRRSEARAAARYSGVKVENIHFLDMPFYETGAVRKRPLSDADIELTVELLERIKPHQVYAAGDLSDPHGTHRTCLSAIGQALDRVRGQDWMKLCETWLYRGAWQEWEPHQIEMAVPLCPDEVERKRMAIFKHESQKDRALFPGAWDSREFWQRAEDRNRQTAEGFDRLGLPEYQAIEAFIRLRSP